MAPEASLTWLHGKRQMGLATWHISLIADSFPYCVHVASTSDWTKHFQTFSKSDFLRFKYINSHSLYWVLYTCELYICTSICTYSLRYMLCTCFFAYISPEMKTFKVLIYYCVLIYFYYFIITILLLCCSALSSPRFHSGNAGQIFINTSLLPKEKTV